MTIPTAAESQRIPLIWEVIDGNVGETELAWLQHITVSGKNLGRVVPRVPLGISVRKGAFVVPEDERRATGKDLVLDACRSTLDSTPRANRHHALVLGSVIWLWIVTIYYRGGT